MLALRPYQTSIIDEARRLMRAGCKRILITAPTGSGKTLLTAHMLKTAAEKSMASFFIVHRRELVKQSIRAFDQVGVGHGVVAAGFVDDPRHFVQICSVQTLQRRWHKLKRPKLVIWDESHHLAAAGWSVIHRALPDAFHIGLTATPERLDGAGLGQYFDEMIEGPSVSWLIQNKFLSPYKMYAPTSVSLEGVRTRMGDFAKSELAMEMDRPSITGDAVREYIKLAAGKRAVVFCVSVEHSKHVSSQFAAAGFASEHVDGETPTELRDAAIRRFERGETKVLCNVDLFGEGFDLPSLEVSILLRPTQSLGLYLQQVGRSLRPSPGKSHAVILDHAGSCARHGLPDEERQWSLEDRARRERTTQTDGPSVKICPKCFAAQFPGPAACQYCGVVFEVKARVIDHVDGDLKEVTKETLLRHTREAERKNCESFEELCALGQARGYKRPRLWAKHIWNYRQSKKNRGA
jgi:DNA repair protein RadD